MGLLEQHQTQGLGWCSCSGSPYPHLDKGVSTAQEKAAAFLLRKIKIGIKIGTKNRDEGKGRGAGLGSGLHMQTWRDLCFP